MITWTQVSLLCYFICASHRTTFSEFAMKYGKDDRFKGIEKMKDRESLFTEFMAELKKKEKENLKFKQDKVCYLFLWGGMREYAVRQA